MNTQKRLDKLSEGYERLNEIAEEMDRLAKVGYDKIPPDEWAKQTEALAELRLEWMTLKEEEAE